MKHEQLSVGDKIYAIVNPRGFICQLPDNKLAMGFIDEFEAQAWLENLIDIIPARTTWYSKWIDEIEKINYCSINDFKVIELAVTKITKPE